MPHYDSADFTLSGENGTRRMRTPVTLNTRIYDYPRRAKIFHSSNWHRRLRRFDHVNRLRDGALRAHKRCNRSGEGPAEASRQFDASGLAWTREDFCSAASPCLSPQSARRRRNCR
jgi:hypothetical protein